jgi:hypothetical protein
MCPVCFARAVLLSTSVFFSGAVAKKHQHCARDAQCSSHILCLSQAKSPPLKRIKDGPPAKWWRWLPKSAGRIEQPDNYADENYDHHNYEEFSVPPLIGCLYRGQGHFRMNLSNERLPFKSFSAGGSALECF